MLSCQFRHYVPVDDESDTDSVNDTIDNESDQIVEKGPNPVRCDYGLCDLE